MQILQQASFLTHLNPQGPSTPLGSHWEEPSRLEWKRDVETAAREVAAITSGLVEVVEKVPLGAMNTARQSLWLKRKIGLAAFERPEATSSHSRSLALAMLQAAMLAGALDAVVHHVCAENSVDFRPFRALPVVDQPAARQLEVGLNEAFCERDRNKDDRSLQQQLVKDLSEAGQGAKILAVAPEGHDPRQDHFQIAFYGQKAGAAIGHLVSRGVPVRLESKPCE